MHAVSARVATRNATVSMQFASPLLAEPDLSSLQMPFGVTRRGSKSSVMAAQTAPLASAAAVQAFARSSYALLTSPSEIASVSFHAYLATGTAAYGGITASLSAYRALIEQSGATALALAMATRDALAATPPGASAASLALGRTVITASHMAIRADVAAAYGLAAAAPASARATVTLIGGAGGALAGAAARVPSLAAATYLRAAAAPATLAPALARAVFGAEYAGAVRFVAGVNTVSARYLAFVETAGRTAYGGAERTRVLASSLAHAPAAIEDAYLGMLGKTALALGSIARAPSPAAVALAAPALSTGEQVALTVFDSINSWFDSATDALSVFFVPAPVLVVAPSPAPLPTPPAVATRAAATTTPPAGASSGVRPIVNSYPTYTTLLQGVSQDSVNRSLEALRSGILATVAGMIQPVALQGAVNTNTIQYVNMIQNLSDLTVHNGNFLGGTFDGGNLINGIGVTATNGSFTSLTGGATSLGATSIAGNLAINGSASITGSLTIGTTTITGPLTAVGPASLGDIVTAGSFVATSTTATNTFAGSLNVDNGGFIYATTTRNVGIGVLSPAALLAIRNSASGQPIFTASNAAGTEVYRLTNAGFVGLGTSTPDALLSLLQPANGTPMISAYRSTDVAPSGDFISYKSAAGTPLFRVDNSGNITGGSVINTGSVSITSTSTPQLRVQYDPSSEWTMTINSTGGTSFAMNGSTPTLAFTPQSNAANTFNFTDASSTSVLSVNTLNKRIGIGTSTPAYTLDVAGPGRFTGFVDAANFVATSSVGTSLFNGALTVNGNSLFTNASTTALTVSGTQWLPALAAPAGAFLATDPSGKIIATTTPSVSNSDGTLTISPTTGTVIASLNLAHANTWTGLQTFNAGTDMLAGQAYKYSGANVITALTSLGDYFFGGAGNLTMTGSYNTATGYQSLLAGTTGGYNVASGYQSLYSNTTGGYNVANGTYALLSNTSGTQNTASGGQSLYFNTTGSYNVATGFRALDLNTSGNYNTATGYYAGLKNTTGSNNTFLGYNAGNADGVVTTPGTLTNATALGYNAQVTASNSLVLGGTGAYGVNVGIGTTSPYATLSVVGTSALGTIVSGTWNGTPLTSPYINFGTGANQVSAATVPTIDTGNYYPSAAANVNATLQDIGQQRSERWSTGLVSGGDISIATGNQINITAGVGYIGTTRVTWSAQNGVAMLYSGDNYIAIGSNGAVNIAATQQNGNNYVLLGYVYTTAANTAIGLVSSLPYYAGNYTSRNNTFVHSSIGAIVESGNLVSATTTPLALIATGGTINANLKEFTTADTTTFTKWYDTADNGWVQDTANNLVNTTQYNVITNNQATALVTMTAGYWKKDLILRTLDGNLHYIYGQAQYSTEQAAKDGALPTTPTAIVNSGGGVYIATVVSTAGDTSVANRIYDVRPNLARVFGFGTSGTTGSVASHSQLSGLLNDDHPQYLLTNGGRLMTGNLQLNSNAITGTTNLTMAGLLQDTLTTEQMRLRYDPSNYTSFTVASNGGLTIAPSGAATTTIGSGLAVGTMLNVSGIAAITGTATVGNLIDSGVAANSLLYTNSSGQLAAASISAPLSWSAGALSLPQANGSTNGYLSSGDWTTFNSKIGSSTIASLTSNYIPKWNGAAFANSLIYDNGTNVGIGTTSPAYTLDVAGNINTSAGSAYLYNGVNVITASTTRSNYFFGGAGNLTMTGYYNTASGVNSLLSNTIGSSNTASGVSSLLSNTTGSSNTASGHKSLLSNTAGYSNTASGANSLYFNTTGYSNTASGLNSLYFNTTGYSNTASGLGALYSNTTGYNNTALGFQAGYGDGTVNMQSNIDTNSLFLGFEASRDASVATSTALTNATAIGYLAKVAQSNSLILGGTGAYSVNVGIGTTNPALPLTVAGNIRIGASTGLGCVQNFDGTA
ncbi:MAG: beta strand repeat-containing protein, partial [Acidobacteriaceae bacterium]